MDKLTCNQKTAFELHGNIQLLEGSLPVLKSCPLLAKQIKNPSSTTMKSGNGKVEASYFHL